MGNLQQLLGNLGGGGGMGAQQPEAPRADTAEQVYVSSLSLLKMLKHGRAGIPMEIMGLMLGEFIDDYTVRIVDVFSMPQSGNSVTVEAVDPVYQTQMLDRLKQTGRHEMVVGWYHSHPGFGCWFSGTDIHTQQSFEQLNPRAVGIVIDPVQSVRGKVVIDCFRLINSQILVLGNEPRQTTSNVGHLVKPSVTALIHGLNRHYYSLCISYRKGELEQSMLLQIGKQNWTQALRVENFGKQHDRTDSSIEETGKLTKAYNETLRDEISLTKTQIAVKSAGKVDAKKRLEGESESLLTHNILECLGTMLGTLSF